MNKLIYRLLSGRFGARLELRILTHRTAKVFHVKAPGTAGLSAQKLLKNYAEFTAAEAGRAIENGQDLKTLHRELFQMACQLGHSLIRWMKPQNDQERLEILILLYRNIGITIDKAGPGKFCIYRCFFCSFYTPEICRIISAIDQGIFAGIFGGGTLKFRGRITEGCGMCQADFQ